MFSDEFSGDREQSNKEILATVLERSVGDLSLKAASPLINLLSLLR